MKWIIGIDEVGRGALAGPVVVAAALIPFSRARLGGRTPGPLKDSKKLSAKSREAWVEYFKRHPDVTFALARVYPRGIEKLNISKAANLAALRAFIKLSKMTHVPAGTPVILDGGLFLGNGKARKPAKTMVKADETVPAVAVASIVAKVSRDRFMCRLARSYPAYGFEGHKGYGTKIHREAIQKTGPCEAHRLTFLRSHYRI